VTYIFAFGKLDPSNYFAKIRHTDFSYHVINMQILKNLLIEHCVNIKLPIDSRGLLKSQIFEEKAELVFEIKIITQI